MKIAHICTEYHPVPAIEGGAVETWIDQISQKLTGDSVHVFSIYSPALPQYHQKEHVRFYHFKKGLLSRILLSTYKLPFKQDNSRLYYLPYSFWCAWTLRKIKPQVIHIHNRPQFVWIMKKLNPTAKIALHIHQISATTEHNLWNNQLRASVDLFLGCSKFVADHIKKIFPGSENKITHAYNGVDINRFRPYWETPDHRASRRAKLGITNEKVFLYSGRLVENKGIEVLMKAFRQLILTGEKNIKLIVCGGSGYSKNTATTFVQKLYDLASDIKPYIHFTGYVPHEDMHEYYAIADWTVVPSLVEEGFGVITIESMACGVPVIAFQRGALPEIIQDNVTGLLILETTSEKLAEKLLQAKNLTTSETMGRKGRAITEQIYSWENVVTELEHQYEKLNYA